MSDVILKVPLGPAVPLRAGGVGALLRHRYMLFCYFGGALLGLVGSSGATGGAVPPEIVFALAASQVGMGVGVMILIARLRLWLARQSGRQAVLRLGWLLLSGTLTAVLTAEVCDTLVMGEAPTPLRFLLAQTVFYTVLAEVMVSALLQFSIDRMLTDLRGAGRSGIAAAAQGGKG